MAKSYVPNDTDRRFVTDLAILGVPQDEIAKSIGISKPTMAKYYRDELDRATMVANAKVMNNLYRMATGEGKEAAIAAMFWLKTRAKWRETSHSQIEMTGKDGEALPMPSLNISFVKPDGKQEADS
jgi:DNA-binding XRE family transcriptional regulator